MVYKFKIGDKVVCIDNLDYGNRVFGRLELNKIYTVDSIYYKDKLNVVGIKEIDDIFGSVRFISLSEYRRKKINKICLKLKI